jgi:hypothetical protein
MVKTNAGQQNLQQSLKNKDKMAVCRKQGDQKIRKKICQIFQTKIAQKVAKSKKRQNIYNKSQFERPKHQQQMTFETLKVAQLAKNRPIW